jgi:hypothetical protein
VQQGATDFAKNCEGFALFLIPEISGIAQKYAGNPLTMRISANMAPSCCASCTQKQHPVQHVEDGGFVVFG